MRHGKKIHKIGRGAAHRKATLASLAIALIEHKHIRTTLAKARALRPYVEPLITKAKTDTTHSRRTVFSVLQAKQAVDQLFTVIGPKVMERPGGYTRILKLGPRMGDGTEMALIELVDYNEFLPSTLGKKKITRRSRRGGKKGGSTEPTAPVATVQLVAPETALPAPEIPAPAAEANEILSEVVEVLPEPIDSPEAASTENEPASDKPAE